MRFLNSLPLQNKSKLLFQKLNILLQLITRYRNLKINKVSVLFELKTGMNLMNKTCLVEVCNPEVRHLIDQSRKSKQSRVDQRDKTSQRQISTKIVI